VWYETNDEVLVRYLLGELAEPERDRLEGAYLSDDALHEQLLAIEIELIDAYVRGDLSADERRHFETRFLTTLEGREWLDLARSMKAFHSRLPGAGPAQAKREPRPRP
jgi:anti-sigma factor RsiW